MLSVYAWMYSLCYAAETNAALWSSYVVQLLSCVWLFATTWLPCPSPSPGVCSDSCPLTRGCHPTISFSAALFSFDWRQKEKSSYTMIKFFLRVKKKFLFVCLFLLLNSELTADHEHTRGDLSSRPLYLLLPLLECNSTWHLCDSYPRPLQIFAHVSPSDEDFLAHPI